MSNSENQKTAQKQGVRVIQVTDPHLFGTLQGKLLNVDTEKTLRKVLKHIRNSQSEVDALLLTGDLAQEDHEAVYTRMDATFAGISPIVRALPGNHDDAQLMRDRLPDDWCQGVTDIGAWRIVTLDTSIPGSNGGTLRDDQLTLIEQSCLQAPDQHVLLAMHHNPVPVGSAWLDPMMIDNADRLMSLVRDLPNVKALLWGHVHQTFDSWYGFGEERAPVRLLATPATCVQFAVHSENFELDDVNPGYRCLYLNDDGSLETSVVRVPVADLSPEWDSSGY